MSMKAKLTVTLKADEVVVAEAEDPVLWQKVLLAVQGGGSFVSDLRYPDLEPAEEEVDHSGSDRTGAMGRSSTDAVAKLAREIGTDRAVVEGAISPSSEAPFLHLNSHNWEAMRKQLPTRGLTALSPIAAAATLLALWFRAAGLGNPTQAQALAVLKGIGEEDKNPSRGVRSAKWLIARTGGQIQLNAAEISTATKLALAFCSKQWSPWTGAKAKAE